MRLGPERVKELAEAALLVEKTPPSASGVTTVATHNNVATLSATLCASTASLPSLSQTIVGQLSSSNHHAHFGRSFGWHVQFLCRVSTPAFGLAALRPSRLSR